MKLLLLAALVGLVLTGCAFPKTSPSDTSGRPAASPAGPCQTANVSAIQHTEPDASLETLKIEIQASGPFSFVLGFPVSSEGTSLSAWLANTTRYGTITATRVATHSGDVAGEGVLMEGQGDARLETCTIMPARGGNNCCAEQYLHAQWSTGGLLGNDVPVRDASGHAKLTFAYEAISRYCGRSLNVNGTLADGGSELAGENVGFCE